MSKRVFHPTIPDVSYEVEDGDAGSWKDAGWRFTDPGVKEVKADSK